MGRIALDDQRIPRRTSGSDCGTGESFNRKWLGIGRRLDSRILCGRHHLALIGEQHAGYRHQQHKNAGCEPHCKMCPEENTPHAASPFLSACPI